MLLDRILERNREYARGREVRPLPPPEVVRLALVACYDPRLDALLLPALGLGPGEAIVLRTAGAALGPDGPAMRSLALGVFLFGVTDVVVLGHTSCRMARFDTSEFIESFRGRGVPREAFGSEDLRQWAGAIPDPKRGVAWTVEAIRSAPFLPRDLAVSGLVLDDANGALETVVGPRDEAVLAGMPAAAAVPAPSVALSPTEGKAESSTHERLALANAVPSGAAAPSPAAEAAEALSRALHVRDRWVEEARPRTSSPVSVSRASKVIWARCTSKPASTMLMRPPSCS